MLDRGDAGILFPDSLLRTSKFVCSVVWGPQNYLESHDHRFFPLSMDNILCLMFSLVIKGNCLAKMKPPNSCLLAANKNSSVPSPQSWPGLD